MERAGVPAVGIVCHGFVPITKTVAQYQGLPSLRLITYPPPNISVQNPQEVVDRAALILDEIIQELSRPLSREAGAAMEARDDREIILKGDVEEVNRFFYEQQWTDGLPVMPPTVKSIEAMLRYTDRSPDEVIGVLPPGNCEASIWKVAVNGVMAGCRPEYLPVLISLTEAIADPRFGLQHAGSTAGWTPLIILNGPIIKELDFNYGPGVLRPERQANITVSRFLRLCMVNIARYRLGVTDMATFGRNYLPVLAEAEQESPWPPLSVDLGFQRNNNIVTVLSSIGPEYQFIVRGSAEEHLRILAQEVTRVLGSQMVYVLTTFGHEWHPVIGMTPLVASIIAQAGYSKRDVRRYLFDHARIPAHVFEELLHQEVTGMTIGEEVNRGNLSQDFIRTEDPDRLVPLVHHPEEFFIVVSGMPQRNRSFVMAQIGHQGLATSKEIKLPVNWQQLLKKA